jgi:hypothetical protein
MKKIYFLFSILLILGITTNSCIYDKVSEEEDDDSGVTPPPPTGATKKTFYLRFLPDQAVDSTSVSTYAGPSLEGTTPVLAWNDSESAGVFMTGSDGTLLYYRKYDFTASTLVYSDTVTTALTTASGYGYSPYQESISETTISYTLDSIQDQSADNSTEYKMDDALVKNVLTISPSSPVSLEGGTCAMTFKSIFAFLRFQVKRSPTVFGPQRIENVKLYVADTTVMEQPAGYSLAGSYTIDVSKAPESSEYAGPVFKTDDRSNVITSSVTGGEVISDSYESPYVWFVINPVKIKPSERLISIVETTSGYKIISKHDIPELKPNAIYTSTIEANENNTVSNQIIEISGGKISNCHIAPSAGIYRMYLKKINGTSSLTGKSVHWLWASKEGGDKPFNISELIDPASIDYNEARGHVDFRVGTSFGKYTKGNVILALKDASDNIVWTWHIWITDTEEIQYDGNKFLDRNIGALSGDTVPPAAIDTYGFVYQWGRKDPFVGGDGITYDESNQSLSVAENHTIVNTSVEWGTDVNKWSQVEMSTNTSVEESGKYPMRFFSNGKSLSENDPADWLYESKTDLWSDDGKTDYDPCPDGYKVPAKDDLDALQKGYKNYEIYLDDVEKNPSVAHPVIWFYNEKNSNRYWGYAYDRTATTFWPLAGMRQGRQNAFGAQLKYAGTDNRMGRAFYWTSTPLNAGKIVPGSSHRMTTNYSGFILYSPDEYGANADAYPVRCVKMTNP